MAKEKVGRGQVRLECTNPNWKKILERFLQDGVEVDLHDFDYTTDGQACERLAVACSMTLQLDARNRVATFKK
jgi:hypothetical protein